MKSPIIVLAYNRPKHLSKMLSCLESKLILEDGTRKVYVFIDGARNNKDEILVQSVIDISNKFYSKGLISEIIISDVNKGLSTSVIDAVSHVLFQHDSVIVLEDDILVKKDFFHFIDSCLVQYAKQNNICSITGFAHQNVTTDLLYPIECKRAMSWSWATWKDRWFDVDFDKQYFLDNRNLLVKKISNDTIGRDVINMLDGYLAGTIDSWYVRWTVQNHFLKRKTVYPSISQIKNIGFDGSGENCSKNQSKIYKQNDIMSIRAIDTTIIKKDVLFERELIKSFNPSILVKIYRKIFS